MKALTLFGRKVRSVREAAGISREVAAERASTTANYLGEIERGEKWPSLELIVELAKALRTSPWIFLDFEAEETDDAVLQSRLQQILKDQRTEQLQTAVRVLRALFNR